VKTWVMSPHSVSPLAAFSVKPHSHERFKSATESHTGEAESLNFLSFCERRDPDTVSLTPVQTTVEGDAGSFFVGRIMTRCDPSGNSLLLDLHQSEVAEGR
jgi:hypothetical protein